MIIAYVIFRYASPEYIRHLILSAGAWGPVVYILCWVFLPMGFFPVPLLAITGGMGFGFFWGAIYTFIGAALNLITMFFMSRYLARDTIQKWLSNRYPAAFTKISNQSYLKRFLVFARIVPLIPYTVENYLFGLTHIKFWDYLYLSLIFILPGTFIYVNIGDKSMDVTSPSFVFAVILLILITTVPVIIERYMNNKKKKQAAEEIIDQQESEDLDHDPS